MPVRTPHSPALSERIIAILAGVLVVKVTANVVSSYHKYFPPDFASDFLRGRERDFFGIYQWAFYTHILSGPVALVLGLILVAASMRARHPRWHRNLGRIQVANVLFLVTPSGLWMARYAAAGPIAALGLAALAVATAVSVSLGAWSATARRFADHRRWMWRCYLLLCSTVVLRLLGGLATVVGVYGDWVDPVTTWMSWLVPLLFFEVRERVTTRPN